MRVFTLDKGQSKGKDMVCVQSCFTDKPHAQQIPAIFREAPACSNNTFLIWVQCAWVPAEKTLQNNFHCNGKSEFHPMFCETQNKVTKNELHKNLFDNDVYLSHNISHKKRP